MQRCRNNPGYPQEITSFDAARAKAGVTYTVKVFEAGHYMCTCPDFVHHSGETPYPCKHIRFVMDQFCGWSSDDPYAEKQKSGQRFRKVCPRCGGGTYVPR